MGQQTEARSLLHICQWPPLVASLLIGLGMVAALRAGLAVNRPPIGAVDSGTFVSTTSAAETSSLALPPLSFKPLSDYLSATNPISAENFVAVPAASVNVPPTDLPCANSRMTMGGWATNARQGAPVARVELYIDRMHVGDALLGLDRPDVEQYFHRPNLAKSGWQVEIPLQQLATGYHYLEIWGVASNGTGRLLLEHHFQCLPPRP